MKSIITALLAVSFASSSVVFGGEKAINNKTKSDVFLTSLTRVGESPANSGDTVAVGVKAGQSAALAYEEQFLNGVRISWSANGSFGVQFEQVTTRGGSLDSKLNTNSTLTLDSVSFIDATGTNTGFSSAGRGKKKFVNKSKQTLRVYLLTRKGDDPANHGAMVGPIQIPAGGSAVVAYRGPFLNGISINWDNGDDALVGQTTVVAERESEWDTALNTNDTITFNSAKDPAIKGSN